MSAGGGGHGTKSVVTALIVNASIAVAKFVGFVLTGSSSMLAEAVHSLADSGNQGLLLVGASRAKQAASEEHPFGYGRERYFFAFVVAVVLFSLGGLFALYEGYQKLREPHDVTSPGIAIGILVFAIIAEFFAFRTAVRESRPLKGDASWWQFIRTAKMPELPVVLLEDTAATIGLTLALSGVGLTLLTGNAAWDAVGTLSIGVLLVIVAVILAIEMKSLLLGESASKDSVAKIRTALGDSSSITRVIHLRTLHLGPEELLVAAKIALADDLTVAQVAAAVNEAEERVRAVVPIARAMYLEPDLYRADRVTATSA